SVVELARGADMLICMCWDHQDEMEANGEGVGQCGTVGAARMAAEAGVKSLVLTHMGPRLSQHGHLEQGIGDFNKAFDGRVIFA
ncbi:MAG: MBL fold metallo-hydrolase, partial [Chloroflexota bacterium]